MALRRTAELASYLEGKPITMLILIMLLGILLRVSILYPSWTNGLPSGYDTYIHAASSYFIAEGGLEASPTSPIYPPLFLIIVAALYKLTGISPVYLVSPVGIVIDVLNVIPMYYVVNKISGNDRVISYVAAFFVALNPISMTILILGSFPSMLSILALLATIAILVSSLRDKLAGVILCGLLGAVILLTNILVAAFFIFLSFLIILYEIAVRRKSYYSRTLFLSLSIAGGLAAIFYVPRLSYFYVGGMGGVEYFIWVFPAICITLILLPPAMFLFKSNWRRRYIPAKGEHLQLLRIWYLTTPIIGLVFIWQVAVVSRLWQFISFPTIIVLAMVAVMKLRRMKRTRKRRTVAVAATALLTLCVVGSYVNGVLCFDAFFSATPSRMQLIGWIEANTPMSSRFCTEEEFLPTHLGWYIMGIAHRMAFESITSFSGPFQVGVDVARNFLLANNVTQLLAGSPEWVYAVKGLNVTFVVLLASVSHTNFAPISANIVFNNVDYVMYNVTEYALS